MVVVLRLSRPCRTLTRLESNANVQVWGLPTHSNVEYRARLQVHAEHGERRITEARASGPADAM